MYYYILGCGIACLILFGINSMDTVCVKPAEILGKVILWPLALMEAVVRYSSTHQAAALFWKAQPPFCFALWRGVWYNKKNPARRAHPEQRIGEL